MHICGFTGPKPGTLVDLINDQKHRWGVYLGHNVFRDPLVMVASAADNIHVLADVETQKNYVLDKEKKIWLYNPQLTVTNKEFRRYIGHACFFREAPSFQEIKTFFEADGFTFDD